MGEEERSGARLGKTRERERERERERKGIFFANGPDRQFLRTQLGWQRRQQQQHRAARTSPSDDDVYACARSASRSDLLVGYAEREEERRGETSKRSGETAENGKGAPSHYGNLTKEK